MQVMIWLVLVVIFIIEIVGRAGRGMAPDDDQLRSPVRREDRVPGGAQPWQRPGGQRWQPVAPAAAPPRQVSRGRLEVDRYAPKAASDTGDGFKWAESPDDHESGEYLGSLGFASEEGASMHDTGTVLGSLSMMFDDEVEDAAGGAQLSGSIVTALALLRSAGDPSEGAGAAVVLAEILGPPRALRRVGPGGARARWH